MLELKNVVKNFGGLQALSGVSVRFAMGEFVGLIGPNGSGKTTLLSCISGLYRPSEGSIQLDGREISRLGPHRIYRCGIGRTFQISKVFARLTVLQNLYIPAMTVAELDRTGMQQRAVEILRALKLDQLAEAPAERLSGGQRKLLEIGMVMMNTPRFLLLDEPFGGVHPVLKNQLEEYLKDLHLSGKSIILVSHEMSSVFRICERLVVLDRGALVTDGPPHEVRADQRVVNAYLGGKHAA
ncbi:ABC transporter ATP-binding protein [Desulfoferrobacter suflitae]|uniref:ABC transporter ATP-binding protein n=1 Tax=Desulfoferrobacter suflitae TaxID=2865782 RepID=UPI0021643A6A|nr:ABC transporter ATP-binding protein [Desulfoferrobacter suflitae]MCK8602515.1 ABC transporter ATP-binding protein [Desulfoferrobacter suflitae]